MTFPVRKVEVDCIRVQVIQVKFKDFKWSHDPNLLHPPSLLSVD